MDPRVKAFMDSMKGKRVDMIGVGVSHRELIPLLVSKGAKVALCDRKTREQLGETADWLESLGVQLKLGPDYLDRLDGEIIFRSPGMKYLTPQLTAARRRGQVVTSELEVFLELCPCPVYGVTGSDGKTTTTTLIAEMLEKQGFTVHKGGNIGRALLPILEQVSPDDRAVVELSSFQLISMRSSPKVAVVTNVAPNHLDVHKDMAEYIDAKKNIFAHQTGFSRTVLNLDNEITASFGELTRGETFFFTRRKKPEQGAFLGEDGTLTMVYRGEEIPILPMGEIRIPGLHNVENYLAAISAVWGEVSPEVICQVARTFGGVEHRIEFVRELCGVKWYNDSIATSPTRAIAGLNAFDQKMIILAGGYDKKIPFEPLAPVMVEKVKLLILTGVTDPKIEAAVRACPGFAASGMEIRHAKDLAEAVAIAHREAKAGDVVSLSPACASFDSYPNFEERGKHFKALVHAL